MTNENTTPELTLAEQVETYNIPLWTWKNDAWLRLNSIPENMVYSGSTPTGEIVFSQDAETLARDIQAFAALRGWTGE